MPFVKGQSGNPGGREKGAERRAKEAADGRTYTAKNGETYKGTDALLHVLLDIAFDVSEKARDRVSAAGMYLDRAHGKAKQAVDVTGALDVDQIALIDALRMTPHERRKRLAEIDAEDQKALDAGPPSDDD